MPDVKCTNALQLATDQEISVYSYNRALRVRAILQPPKMRTFALEPASVCKLELADPIRHLRDAGCPESNQRTLGWTACVATRPP